jgi:hypothetical protein
MTMKLTDAFTVDNVHRTSDGYLAAFARVARTGIQIYRGSEVGRPDMGEVRVYRPPDEVFNADALRSFAHRPVTLTHPKVPVTSKNWKKYSGGQTGDHVVRDGEFIRVPMVMMDQRIIDAYEKQGIKELSMGYSTDLKWTTDGKAPDGTACDAYQTNIRGNHLAVVPLARGGDKLRIGDASGWQAMLDKMDEESDPDGDDDEDEDEDDVIGEYLSSDALMYDTDFTAAQREELAKSGAAMPGGGFPIRNAEDLHHAMEAIGRAKDPSAAKAHIRKRAKALGLESELSASFKDAVLMPKGSKVKLSDPGDYNHNKKGTVVGPHPTDPSRMRVKFGSMTTSHPQANLTACDADNSSPDYVSCPYCGGDISPDASKCPHCDAYVSPTKDGVPTMKQLIIDGVPVDVANDQSAAIIDRHIANLTKAIKDAKADLEKMDEDKKKAEKDCTDAKATISARDGEIVVLKKQVTDAAVTPEKLDTMVKDRLAVITAAGSILDSKTYTFDGKSSETIRRDAVSLKLGDSAKGMDDATIVGAFTALTADAVKKGSGTRQFADNLRQANFAGQTVTNDAATARDAAFAENTKRLNDAWRSKAQ